MHVYVINKHGEPLMPCKPRKARALLQKRKATVANQEPFTIRLLYGSSGYRQPITLGMDAGSKHIGIAAATDNEVLYAEEMQPGNDVVRLLSIRRQNRRSRRNRKTGYRESGFDNRVHSKHKGWLALLSEDNSPLCTTAKAVTLTGKGSHTAPVQTKAIDPDGLNKAVNASVMSNAEACEYRKPQEVSFTQKQIEINGEVELAGILKSSIRLEDPVVLDL